MALGDTRCETACCHEAPVSPIIATLQTAQQVRFPQQGAGPATHFGLE